ncbi:MAG: hypothetical protein Q7R63_00690, partial [bacterium]|nr:hypothetical protein [bacterium]
MNAKKIIFAFFACAVFISGNVFAAGMPVLYSAPWCGPCNDLKDELDGKILGFPGVPGWRNHIRVVNTDELPRGEFRPSSIPALY